MMGRTTSIEWTRGDDGKEGATWNPLRGCSFASPGCHRCYALGMAARFSKPGLWGHGFAEMVDGEPRWTKKVELAPEHLDDPLHWREPKRIFVNSTSDLFHEEMSNEDIAAVHGIMAASPHHTYQLLTKRSKRAREWHEWIVRHAAPHTTPVAACVHYAQRYEQASHPALRNLDEHAWWRWPLPNLWLGASVENQEYADRRIPDLLATPAAVRFISAEPLLGPIVLDERWLYPMRAVTLAPSSTPEDIASLRNALNQMGDFVAPPGTEVRTVSGARLDWVIAGAESGHGHRPMDEDWVRALRDQCARARVAFFFKQRLDARGRKVSLPLLDGEAHAAFPAARDVP